MEWGKLKYTSVSVLTICIIIKFTHIVCSIVYSVCDYLIISVPVTIFCSASFTLLCSASFTFLWVVSGQRILLNWLISDKLLCPKAFFVLGIVSLVFGG